MREAVTTLLDVLGLLLVAAGAVFGVAELTGVRVGTALAVGGAVILAGSWWAARPPKRKAGDG